MLSLIDLGVIMLLVLAGFFVWQHHRVRNFAYRAALRHTRFHEVVLLDQTIVLKSMRLRRSNSSLFAFERCFQFEFASLGDERYKGETTFVGLHQTGMRLQAFKTDFKGEPLE